MLGSKLLRPFMSAGATAHTADPDPAPNSKTPVDPVAQAIETLLTVPSAEIQRRGYHFQPRDYYSALNDLAFLDANRDLWQGRPLPAGIDWNLDRQFELLRTIAPHADELADVPHDAPPEGTPSVYYWDNNFWRGMDSVVQYGLLRHLRPARVVEVGCGWSSLLMARALALNQRDGAPAIVHQIEPYPRVELMASLPGHWKLEACTLQRAPLAPIEALTSGDILFYDGSHVARAASDVNWLFFEILPRVAPGVMVHIHDVFWPSDYPESWIFERARRGTSSTCCKRSSCSTSVLSSCSRMRLCSTTVRRTRRRSSAASRSRSRAREASG